jgi:hypothetical protein
VAADPTEAFDWIKEPGLAAYREIEAAVAVRHDVEPGCFLFGDDAGDGVKVLLAEQGIPERGFELSSGKAAVKPKRPRVRARDGGGKDHVARDGEHGDLRGLRTNDKDSAPAIAPKGGPFLRQTSLE